MTDYVDQALGDVSGIYGHGGGGGSPDDMFGNAVSSLVEVGALEAVAAQAILSTPDRGQRQAMLSAQLARTHTGAAMPSPPFARSARDTTRRAPLGFIEDNTGAFFFTLPAGPATTTTMRAKVSRAAHTDRLLIVPSAPGVVMRSILVGDEEQILAAGAPVELYSVQALTDSVPDNFSPLSPALDFVVVLINTTLAEITGTMGIKAGVDR